MSQKQLSGVFGADQITDQKRCARGEQLQYARTRLQGRDVSFSKPWRVLMLAGAAPQGEINAIRELMPKAHITALDRDPKCLEVAIDSGADEIIQADLSAIERKDKRPVVCSALRNARFDLVDLDLCSNANESTKSIARIYQSIVSTHGIFMFSFSYGRDVVPAFEEAWWDLLGGINSDNQSIGIAVDILEGVGKTLGEHVRNRLAYIFNPSTLACLHSIIVYKGASMPMCSLLFQSGRVRPDVSMLRLDDGDFQLAVTFPDPSKLYDCPQSRIESLRRRFTALKAVATREARRQTL